MFRFALILALTLMLPFCSPALAQQEITSTSFEAIPEGTELVGGSAPILLDSDTDVNGEVSTNAGVRFPDGTLQLTAAAPNAANFGLYSNRIPDVTPPNPYTEICFKNGGTTSDIHGALEPTTGGNCLPGDTGWIIERDERDSGATSTWTQARATCLQDGMRLPEPFEYQFVCDDAAGFGMADMTDEFEWSSNRVMPILGSTSGLAVSVVGDGACDHATWRWPGQNSGTGSSIPFRCAL